jgi:drug/metabolite transporter (DMT)-like permease
LLLVSPLFVDNWAIPPIAFLWIFASGSMRGFVWMMFNVGIKRIGPSRGSILFLSHSFFVVGIQLLADWLFPGLNLRVPPNLILSLAGGALIAFGISYMQREKAPVPVPLT